MNVLFVSAEMAPFAKTGGLGDVAGSLPRALQAKGIDARVVIPLYGPIKARYGDDLRPLFTYQFSRRSGTADVHVYGLKQDGVPVYFLESWPFFSGGEYIYTDLNWDRERFVFFSQAAMALAWELGLGRDGGEGWFPDVLHAHDWHTGLVPFLLHEARRAPEWRDVASVLTIHNMGYQGWEAGGYLWAAGVPGRHEPNLVYQDKTDNLLGIGIAYADKLNTVSPRHAAELHYPRFGEGLEGLIRVRDADFTGILNGLDMERIDPAADPAIDHPYDVSNFRTERMKNKRALQSALGLEPDESIPLIGIVSRLVDQKGFDFAIPGLRLVLAETDAQLVALGSGDFDLETHLRTLEWDFNWKTRVMIGYNPALSMRIYAGADLVLVPSRYEPCGLTQMMSMRYGALPVVRETGGLADTVENYDGGSADRGTGFTFLWEEDQAVRGTLRWAMNTFRTRRAAFERMQERAMRLDWSWDKPAREYVAMYEKALAIRRA
ncbi:MAG TPA: glycogen synthase [Aggregatilinea sp.]|uniref:glycogen synthase n=1 Tax=Aggregatilinea sp. TaxID=2806333 RepID=UPI002CF01128|nr:glycogen synthase [Aggregatilinea sp.]HML21745.1 glycogen synthase [Aggregatilinea sp.]